MITEEIKKNIITELGLENLSAEKADEVMARLEQNIERSLILEVLDLLPVGSQQEFIKIAETKNNQEIKAFLENKIPNFDSLAKAVAESVVKEFKALSK